jgi:lipid II:glycine glycyltransferase (peptidoglycan interpeptide bridge formation enzyme)
LLYPLQLELDLEVKMITQPWGGVQFVVCHDPAEAHPWDAFVSKYPGAHYEQTSGWGKVKQIYGWKPTWVWIARGVQILGGAMILTRRVGRFATIGYVMRGPVWAAKDPDSMQMATEALCQFARSLRLTYLVIVPPYAGEDLIPLLQSLHFHRKPNLLPPSVITATATLMIDLQQDLDAILAGMSKTKRQNIRRGLRRGVQVRTGGGADAETFRKLMWLLCKRRGISPSPPQEDFFENLWRMLGPAGIVKFFIAEIRGEAVSAACTLAFGDTMQLWRVGWSGKYDDYDPNDVLHWEVIKWAKENGFRMFDFMHIQPDHARAILRGKKVNDSYSGVTDFKMGFGGQPLLLPEPYYRSFHPVVHSALCLGAARVMGSSVGIKILQKVANKVINGLSLIQLGVELLKYFLNEALTISVQF